jgi:hypothetical protein
MGVETERLMVRSQIRACLKNRCYSQSIIQAIRTKARKFSARFS